MEKKEKKETLLQLLKRLSDEDLKSRGLTSPPKPLDPNVGKLNPEIMFFRMIESGVPQEIAELRTGIRVLPRKPLT